MNIINRIANKIDREYKEKIKYPNRVKDKQKIFCIGRNKTGTTSIKKAFLDLGFIVGNQRTAEKLLPYYKKDDFDPIIRYCKSAQVFQDFPFSFPNTYKYLNEQFPNSKFILTVRDSPDQWYNSLIKFHSKVFGKGHVPQKEDLQEASYVWKGWIWECNRMMYNTPENDVYNKQLLIETYNTYNNSVREYFQDYSDKLIEINVSKKGEYNRVMKFLNIESPFVDFPWENNTEKLKIK